jgi:LacI family transcriptional regulator
MRVTLKDVARKARVSTATVSRVINNKHQGNVSQATYLKIQAVLQETGYVQHAIASGLRTGLTKVVGIVVPDNVNPYYAQLGSAIENACFQAGYTALICNTNRDVEREKRYMRLLSSQRVAGIILCSTGLTSDDIQNAVQDITQVVLVDESVEGFDGAVIIGDDRRGGYIGMDYLYGLGHEEILIVTGPMNLSSAQERLRGVLQCAADRQRTVPPERIVNARYTIESAYGVIRRVLEEGTLRFSAVFCHNDLMAIGAMKALDEHGREVPQDVSVLGYDNIFLNDIVKPALTTVETPIKELGVRSFQLIADLQKPSPAGGRAEAIAADGAGVCVPRSGAERDFRQAEPERFRTDARRAPGKLRLGIGAAGRVPEGGMDGKAPAGRQILLAPKLVVRNSCRAVR